MNQIVESKEMEMPTPLIFTDNAVKKVKALIEEEGHSNKCQNGDPRRYRQY